VIEQGQLPPDKVIAFIEAQETVWVRLAATRKDDEWHESVMEVTGGVAPPRWTPQRWEYEEAIFVSSEVCGAKVAEWLRTDTAVIDDVAVKLPTVQPGQALQWWQRSSGTTNDAYETLNWPFKSYQLAPQPLKNGPGSGSLIGKGPSFVRFAQAAASFFGFSLGLGGSVDHMAPTFRLQDLSGRIAKVLLGAIDVEIRVEGKTLDGMTVELASDTPGPSEVLSSQSEQSVRFPLPGGLSPGAWVVLKRDFEWIDRKFINYPHTLSPDPGVEMIVEPMTELQALVSGGEGGTVEFKSVIPEPGTKLRDKVCQTVAAFSNGEGGQVLFGVQDDGMIIGLPTTTDEKEARDTVTRFVTSTVTPLPNFSIESVHFEDSARVVIVLTVESGGEPPYGVSPANPQYYVRRGATTFPASADQVRALARSRPPADQANGSPIGLFHPFT
jgi:hypothetical protein